jgi:hypothetical protein
MSPFSAPFSWGTQKREAAAHKASGCFMGGTCDVSGGTGKAEAAKLPGAGIGPKQCPGKCAAEKGHLLKSLKIEDEAQTRSKQWRGLLETQGHDRVDARGAARWDVTGCNRDKR